MIAASTAERKVAAGQSWREAAQSLPWCLDEPGGIDEHGRSPFPEKIRSASCGVLQRQETDRFYVRDSFLHNKWFSEGPNEEKIKNEKERKIKNGAKKDPAQLLFRMNKS